MTPAEALQSIIDWTDDNHAMPDNPALRLEYYARQQLSIRNAARSGLQGKDAALIAAAPDLLAALSYLLERYDSLPPDDPAVLNVPRAHIHMRNAAEQARAALLKACPQGQELPDTEN